MTTQTGQDTVFTVPAVTGKPLVRTGKGFIDGMCCGYLNYFDEYAGLDLKDSDIRPLLLEALYDAGYSEEWNTGYVVGWVEALLADRRPLEYIPEAG